MSDVHSNNTIPGQNKLTILLSVYVYLQCWDAVNYSMTSLIGEYHHGNELICCKALLEPFIRL